jgi:endoglycosylceramidase
MRSACVALVAACAAPAAQAAPTPPLGHAGRWITDAEGRVVILHGVNMVYKKKPTYYPSVTGFGDDDAAFLARHGFNTVRLGVIYAGVESKKPGQYDDAYIDHVAETERVLARHGVFSLVDFHQDMYNERFEGEGWPDWAVQTDGLQPERGAGFPGNYVASPALNRAYDHFWANDEVGGAKLQDAYAAAWRRVASKFSDRPYVMGYDLFNEPWPGSVWPSCANPPGCPTADMTLTAFSKRAIAQIRKADARNLVWYEPYVLFNFGADTSHGDTGDARAGMSFHNYCLDPSGGQQCDTMEQLVFDNADKQSVETGDALLLTEFGATDNLAQIRRIVDDADDHMVGWQYWAYCGCEDPTTQGPGAVQAVVIDPKKPPTGSNVKTTKLKTLERPYPQAVAGTPQSFGFDPVSKRFDFVYAPVGDLETEVFVPELQYPDGYSVKLSGAQVVSDCDASVLRLVARPGAKRVTATVTPDRCTTPRAGALHQGTIGGRFVISRRAVKLGRNGIAKVRVSCRSPLGCRGRLTLRTARRFRGARVALGSRSFSFPRKRPNAVVRVRLSATGRELLARVGRTPVEAVARVRIGSAIRGTAKARFRLHRAHR